MKHTVPRILASKDIYAFLSNLLKECFSLSYRFYSSLDNPPPQSSGENYVCVDDIPLINRQDEYPDSGRDGYTDSTYRYSDTSIELVLFYNETWQFGAIPSDNRYSMPEKKTLNYYWGITLRTTDSMVSLTITVYKTRGKTEFNLESGDECTKDIMKEIISL